MRSDDVLEYVRQQPLRPFRITLTDGREYSVQHPELAMAGRSTVTIGIPRPGEIVYDRLVTVSLLHIMQIELIEPAAAEDAGSAKALTEDDRLLLRLKKTRTENRRPRET